MFSFLFDSSLGLVLYHVACLLLWLLLAGLWLAAMRKGYPDWLGARPRLMVLLLGTDRMPERPGRTLKRFYSFLAGGWSWILLWSWWLGPLLKEYFFRNVGTTKAYEMARISTMIVVAAYAAAGFYAVGKAVTIWFKEIYAPAAAKR